MARPMCIEICEKEHLGKEVKRLSRAVVDLAVAYLQTGMKHPYIKKHADLIKECQERVR